MSENLYAKEKSVLENNSAVELHPTSSDRVGMENCSKVVLGCEANYTANTNAAVLAPSPCCPRSLLSSAFCLCEPEEWI